MTSAMDNVNVRRMVNQVKQSLDNLLNPIDPDTLTLTPARLGETTLAREELVKIADNFLKRIEAKGLVNEAHVGKVRRVLWEDVYPRREDRVIAVSAHRRARQLGLKLNWGEGTPLTEEQVFEYGHLLRAILWGTNDDLTGYVYLPRPSGYIMDIYLTPVQPINYITLNIEVSNEQVQFSEVRDHDARPHWSDRLRGD